MKKKLLFIINPKAGRTAIKNDLFEIIMVFSQAGYEVVTYPTTGPEDAERKVCADGAEYDLIVCAGGDGTLENTVCGYMKMGEKKVPLGYIPVGTTNDFARSLKISRKPLEAAKQIVTGDEMFIDVGCMDDKNFIYIAAFGIFTDISYSTNQSLKKVMGHSAYIVEALKNITNYRGFQLEADFDGKVVTGEYIYGMITNSFSVAGFKIRGAKHVVLDDGKFDCLFIKMPQNAVELQQILTALLKNDIEGNEMFFECKASKVIIRSETPIPWTLDGEFGGEKTEVTLVNKRKAIGLYLNPASDLEGIDQEHDEIAAVADEDIMGNEDIRDTSLNIVYDADVEDDYCDGWD
ncbi:MAG: diacylglycerol/lipid kinase family protein [Wujia sp.]